MDEWIKDAMENAYKDVLISEEIANIIREHLDKKTEYLLDVFDSSIDQRNAAKFALAISSFGLEEVLSKLSFVFFAGGYTSALDDVREGKVAP